MALAIALRARACELVKDAPGLLDADPRLVPGARPLPRVSHRFVTELAGSGARVLHHPAAVLAERAGLPLRFVPLPGGVTGGTAGTTVERGPGEAHVAAVAVRHALSRFTSRLSGPRGRDRARRVRERCEAAGLHPEVSLGGAASAAWLDLVLDAAELDDCLEAAAALLAGNAKPTLVASGLASVTVVTEAETIGLGGQVALQEAAATSGVTILTASHDRHRQRYLVPERDAVVLARALHEALRAARLKEPTGRRTTERIA